jgi:ubiquinone/menaquinone biosynthesis C-methylase UbiE
MAANLALTQHEPRVHVCPDCLDALEGLFCGRCGRAFPTVAGFPMLLPAAPRFASTRRICLGYDAIYRFRTNVWEEQGGTTALDDYLASLIAGLPAQRFLEIGCGQGSLLSLVQAEEKHATELSTEALKFARGRTRARFCVALAERLPFPDEYFDVVATVGVMTHFLDEADALSEIRRVLKPGGHYVNLIHVRVTLWERIAAKLSQYLFPRPRLVQLVRWIAARGSRAKPEPYSVVQPVQNSPHTRRSAKASIESAGLEVTELIHTGKQPGLPLAGPHVAIYLARR